MQLIYLCVYAAYWLFEDLRDLARGYAEILSY